MAARILSLGKVLLSPPSQNDVVVRNFTTWGTPDIEVDLRA
jgi:hypothetical protein